MAQSFTCDGCGANVEVPAVIGFVLKRDYCEACAGNAKAFLEEEEKARVVAQSDFTVKRDRIVKKFCKVLTKLPDVP